MSVDQKKMFSTDGFSRLDLKQRFARLIELGMLTPEEMDYLRNGGIHDLFLAEKMIENAIGYFQIPLGVATHFHIDEQDYLIPMAVEETSIIAAASKTAKWVKQHGKITTRSAGEMILGQIQFAPMDDFAQFEAIVAANQAFLIEKVNEDVARSMVARGGGVQSLCVRQLPHHSGQQMPVIHVGMHTCDAMGANILNQVLEYLKPPLEQLTGKPVLLCILTNFNDQKLTHATVLLEGIDPVLGQRIEEASRFAETDVYRAATHNKGVMNGMDPVVLATGNDWRAVEAAVHAYATREGRYKAISQWRFSEGQLKGELEAPIVVGTVGGMTSVHPTAKLCLNMLGVRSASHLSRLIAAVGLIQNLGALKALCTEGIIQGHMRLHIDNLLLMAGANEEEMSLVKTELTHALSINKSVSLTEAKAAVAGLRAKVGS